MRKRKRIQANGKSHHIGICSGVVPNRSGVWLAVRGSCSQSQNVRLHLVDSKRRNSEVRIETETSSSSPETMEGMSIMGAVGPVVKQRRSADGSGHSQQAQPQLSNGAPCPPDLASFFECPVCFDYVLPPIYQCQAGHLVCCTCRPKLNCCPTCRGPLGNIRNLAMEKVASTVVFPCKYSSNGCGALLLHTEKTDHEEGCECRPYFCPCPGTNCKWQGSLDQVMPHLLINHKSITTLQGEDIVFLATDINLPGAVDWVMMQSCFGYNFMLVLEKQEKNGGEQFFAIVQLIGSRKQTEKFAYRLELNGHRRRLIWEATPNSIHEGVSFANSDCLYFDTNTAKLFSENGNLGINVTISMVK